jgi:hypothetical protein
MKMSNIRERLNKNIEMSRNNLTYKQELLDCLPIEQIQDAFPMGEWGEWWTTGYEFALPLSFQLIDEFQEFVQQSGWAVYNVHNHVWDDSAAAGTFFDVYLNPNEMCGTRYFHVAFRSTKEGSTCVVQQIGTKEVPVYEVTCADGAEENTWEK